MLYDEKIERMVIMSTEGIPFEVKRNHSAYTKAETIEEAAATMAL